MRGELFVLEGHPSCGRNLCRGRVLGLDDLDSPWRPEDHMSSSEVGTAWE